MKYKYINDGGYVLECGKCNSQVPLLKYRGSYFCEICMHTFEGDVYIAAAQVGNIIRRDLGAFKGVKTVCKKPEAANE